MSDFHTLLYSHYFYKKNGMFSLNFCVFPEKFPIFPKKYPGKTVRLREKIVPKQNSGRKITEKVY